MADYWIAVIRTCRAHSLGVSSEFYDAISNDILHFCARVLATIHRNCTEFRIGVVATETDLSLLKTLSGPKTAFLGISEGICD